MEIYFNFLYDVGFRSKCFIHRLDREVWSGGYLDSLFKYRFHIVYWDKIRMCFCFYFIFLLGIFLGGVIRLGYYALHTKNVKQLVEQLNKTFLYKVPTMSGDVTFEKYIKYSNFFVKFWRNNILLTSMLMSIVPLLFTYKTGR